MQSHGSAESFHRRDPDPEPTHQLWVHTAAAPALILGSTQPDDLIQRARATEDGIEVCRRLRTVRPLLLSLKCPKPIGLPM